MIPNLSARSLTKIDAIAARLLSQLAVVNRAQIALFLAWLVSMIALPIAKWIWGDTAITPGVMLNVGLQLAFVLVVVGRAWGVWHTLLVAGIVALLTLIIEAIGTATGWPFGAYTYTGKLQPQIAHVPLLIPAAWLMMLPTAWAVAQKITGHTTGWRFIALSALAMVAWDLFLDPQMVAWGFWVWTEPGGYFGIPWLNFAGWFATAALVTWLARPQRLPVIPLLLMFTVIWLLESIGLLLFWGLPGPALVGFVAMGGLVVAAWRSR